MKKLLALFMCVMFLSASIASASTTEAHNKKAAKPIKRHSKQLAAKKNAIHQKKVLKVMEKDLTIKRSPADQPETSPRDVHPSGQF
jgi:hypothetical protein